MSKEILFLEPVFTHNIWGGTRLRSEFGYKVKGDDVGECWGIAAHEKGDCTVESGTYQGKKLSQLWEEHPELFGNIGGEKFPLMVKIIDAKEDLSIQVHPDDAYARRNEKGSFGKTECWYVLDCKEDSALIVGHNAKTHDEMRAMVDEGRWDEFVRRVPVKKGSFVQIEPGCIHAITGGLLLFETEQNSDITYRVYDYDRKSNGKLRELHLKESMEVIAVPSKDAERSVLQTADLPKNQWNELIGCDSYRVWKLQLSGEITFLQDEPFLMISVLEGSGELNGIRIEKGKHMILPSGFGMVNLTGNMELIASSVGNGF